jgi:uncharacterized protein (DUF1684 family)
MEQRLVKNAILASVFVLIGIILTACSESEITAKKLSSPQSPILLERAARDEDFKSGENSPIPKQNRTGFRGLSYYPLNPVLRFSVRLNRYPSPKQIRMGTNTGEIRSGLRYGYFDFQVGGQSCRLQVYRLDDTSGNQGPSLFVPFRDATSGNETYAAGRYIDLAENTIGNYDLDFNRAYNPFCAYNSKFSCPVPPAENKLKVSILAGEKNYSKRAQQ